MHMHARNQIREILLLRELHNENIVSLKDVFLSGTPQHAHNTHNATPQQRTHAKATRIASHTAPHREQHRTTNARAETARTHSRLTERANQHREARNCCRPVGCATALMRAAALGASMSGERGESSVFLVFDYAELDLLEVIRCTKNRTKGKDNRSKGAMDNPSQEGYRQSQ